MQIKRLLVFTLTTLFCLLTLPGALGYLAKEYIERGIYLNNLNTALHLEISDYQQGWFSSSFNLTASVLDEFEESHIEISTLQVQLGHGPVTVINRQPGIGAFYLFTQRKTDTSKQPSLIAFARAGFLGNIQLNLNLNMDSSDSQETKLQPLIASIEADYEFDEIHYRIHWQGASSNDQNSGLNVKNLRLAGAIERKDDQSWQGNTEFKAEEIDVPNLPLRIKQLTFSIHNVINIEESAQATHLIILAKSNDLKTPWSHWQNLTLDARIHRADLAAMSAIYDLIEKVYLEFDSITDEYAQLEYMTAIQTLTPALLSDRATLNLNQLSFYSPTQKQHKRLTGKIEFPDLPEYMDDHLLSLIAKTKGKIELTEEGSEPQQIEILKGKISVNNKTLSQSLFN